jgi:hypothetical protein
LLVQTELERVLLPCLFHSRQLEGDVLVIRNGLTCAFARDGPAKGRAWDDFEGQKVAIGVSKFAFSVLDKTILAEGRVVRSTVGRFGILLPIVRF